MLRARVRLETWCRGVALACAALLLPVVLPVVLPTGALGGAGPAAMAQDGPAAGERQAASRSDTPRQDDARQAGARDGRPDTVFVASDVAFRGTIQAQIRWRTLTDSAKRSAGEAPSIGGLVVDETRTTIGSRFYDAFYGRWETPDSTGAVTLRIREQPRPNLGTRVLVDVEGTVVFRATLRPDRQQIRKAAQAAQSRARRYVKQWYEPRQRY